MAIKNVYLASPLNAPTKEGIRENMELARKYVKEYQALFPGAKLMATHAWMPEFIDDNDPEFRELALWFGRKLLKMTDAVLVCGGLSQGVRKEVELAIEIGLPIYTVSSDVTKAIISEFGDVLVNEISDVNKKIA